jgi:hypothetical protein
MSWKISPQVADILRKAQQFEELSTGEIVVLLRLELCSGEAYALMCAANRMSREGSSGSSVLNEK